jgi:hypothetical protein
MSFEVSAVVQLERVNAPATASMEASAKPRLLARPDVMLVCSEKSAVLAVDVKIVPSVKRSLAGMSQA